MRNSCRNWGPETIRISVNFAKKKKNINEAGLIKRWEFINETRKQELDQESDQENKKENKKSTKEATKKNFLFFLITFLVEFLFSFINFHLRVLIKYCDFP